MVLLIYVMQHLKYLNKLDNIIKDNKRNILSSSATKLLQAPKIDDLPHLIVHGKCKIFTQNFIEGFLEKYHSCESIDMNTFTMSEVEVTNASGSKNVIPFKSHRFWIEIDLDCNNNNDKNLICQAIKSLGSHVSYTTKRHIIILKNMSNMPDLMDYALRNILEDFIKTTLFILVTDNLSKINETIRSRCMIVNTNISIQKMMDLASILVSQTRPDVYQIKDLDLYDLLKHANFDIISLSIILEFNSPTQYTGHKSAFVINKLDELVCSLSSKSVTYLQFAEKLRDFVIRIGASCIPIKSICKDIVAYVVKNKPVMIHDIVPIIADMEHMSQKVNKSIFVLEGYIEKIARLLAGYT